MENKKNNIAITYLRVIAMLGIFIDHAYIYSNLPMKNIIVQITNSFVLLFLLISGFLYGGKTIKNFKEWFLKKVKVLLIPYWIFLAVYFTFISINSSLNIKSIIIYVLNLQGLFGTEVGPGTTWFLTLLFMCYLLIPILQYIKNNIIFNKLKISIILLSLILIQGLLAFYCNITLDFGHLLSWYIMAFAIFIFGYFTSNIITTKGINKRAVIYSTILMLIFNIVKVVANMYIDGTLIYDNIIALYGNIFLNIWLFIFCYYFITKYSDKFRNKFILYLSSISYSFYLVHDLILSELNKVIANDILFITIGVLASAFFAIVLYKISNKLIMFVEKERKIK